MNYKKSPVYRTGNKHKVLNKIMPLFPKNIKNFYDVFGGSGVVSMNVPAEKKIYNELDPYTFGMIEYLKNNNEDDIANQWYEFKAAHYNGNGKEFFERTKEIYNNSKEYRLLWYLSLMSFSNGIRFNDKGFFNQTYGFRMGEDKLNELINLKDLKISNKDFRDFINCEKMCDNDFVFLDPPYLLSQETNASAYNLVWSEKEEKELVKICENLNRKNIKFMITNIVSRKGEKNNILLDMIEKNNFKTFVLSETNKSNGIFNDDYLEIAIMNYQPPSEQITLF